MSKELPKQKAARLRGELAAVLCCRVEDTDSKVVAQRKLDELLTRIERMESQGPEPSSISLRRFNTRFQITK